MLTAVHIHLVNPCNDTHTHMHTLQIQEPSLTALITQRRLLVPLFVVLAALNNIDACYILTFYRQRMHM